MPSADRTIGLGDEPPRAFPASEVVAVRLSEAGFRRMLRAVDATFVLAERQPQATGPGLYGPSLFYRANGAFSLLSLCNHWTDACSPRQASRARP